MVNASADSSSLALLRVPIEGGGVVTLATDTYVGGAIAVDGGMVFWASAQ